MTFLLTRTNNKICKSKILLAAVSWDHDYKGSDYDPWKAYEYLSRYIETHGYTPSGYPQEIYLEIGAGGSVRLDGSSNITRVIIPIKRNG